MQQIRVTVEGQEKVYQEGISYEKIAEEYQEKYNNQIGLVYADGKIRELLKTAHDGVKIDFITLSDTIGHQTYVRTATFLLMKAIHDVIPEGKVEKAKIEFALGAGFFCNLQGDVVVDEALVEKVATRMRELRDSNVSIEKKAVDTDEAIRIFKKQGMYDKVKLFHYRRSSQINVYSMDGFQDYYYGYMLPNVGYVKNFEVKLYHGGMMLQLPNKKDPTVVPPVANRENLFNTMMQATDWSKKMGIDTVGDLNDCICQGRLSDMILVQEALMESRIGDIAQDIVSRGGIKFVMIAGPSSSGKTTFSHRLSIQLKAHGLQPHPIAVDDYFVNREKTPKDADGNYNFECLEAIDVEQFNKDMTALLAGNEVELPTFNFKTGLREYKGNIKKLGADDVLVIEGIHALNDKMSFSLPGDSKYKIYISALTTLNVDEHNRIPTTDARMLRRMVRDARTRGTSAQKTIRMWSSVRRGEEENIFPFQESADAMFNSALIYELAVLKQFAEPLLFGIDKSEPEYYEAKRLLKFLEYFLGVSSENLPNNSIIREFVGGSYFNV